MATNGEWLDYLAQNAPDELAAWFDAERVTKQAEMLHMPESHESATMQHIGQVIENTIKRGVYGDTEPENADSRERLEADVHKFISYACDDALVDVLWADETFTLYDAIIELLDRQAAITKRKTTKRHELFCETCEAESDKQIAKLTAERNRLTNAINELQKKQPYCYNPEQPLDTLNAIGRYIDGLTAERDELKGQVFTLKCECEDLEHDEFCSRGERIKQ